MNATIVSQEAQLQMEQMLHNPWYAGFLAYCQGAQLEDMPTVAHKRGWWAALDAQAGATMPVKAVDTKRILTIEEMNDEHLAYEDDILDREFWARGQW